MTCRRSSRSDWVPFAAIAILLLAAANPTSAAQDSLKVRIGSPNGYHVVDLPLEKYVAAVLAGESSVFKSDEALKAMAVAARTFDIKFRARHASEGFDLCATTHCQRIDLGAVTPRLQTIADATAGEFLWFQGKLALTPYSGDCGGRTEDVSAVWPGVPAPYLKSREDPNCLRAGSSSWRWTGDPVKIAEALRRSGLRTPEQIGNIGISRRSPSGRTAELLLEGDSGAVRISASSFRFAMERGLGWNTVRSEQYDPGGWRPDGFRWTRFWPRRGLVPTRSRSDGRRRPRLSRDSGLLLCRRRGRHDRKRPLLEQVER